MSRRACIGPFLGTLNNRCRTIIGTPKRDHNFDNYPYPGCHETMQRRLLDPDPCAPLGVSENRGP